MIPKRKKIDKFDFIKILYVCSAKNPVKKMKTQVQTGKIYLQSQYTTNDSSRIRKEISKLNIKKIHLENGQRI